MASSRPTPKDREILLNTPYEYTLIDSDDPGFGKENPIVYNTFGCPEDDKLEDIKRVGDLAKEVGGNAHFGLQLGDNFTPQGVRGNNSAKFITNFHNVHALIIFAILGNHDVPNDDATLAQILHTFVDIDTGEWDAEKIKIWEEKTVDLAKLRRSKNNWNMPGRYGVLHCGHTDFFAIDSSKFVSDFLNYFVLKTDKNPNNQAAWLFRAVRESGARNKIILSHHAFHDISKRSIVSDHPDYLTPAQMAKLKEAGITGNYNEILNKIMFLAEDLSKGFLAGPGPLLSEAETAHHHGINYFNGKSTDAKEEKPHHIRQWVSGGAGGPHQQRLDFESHEQILLSTAQHGFVQKIVSADGKSDGTVYTAPGHCVRIVNDAIVKKPREEKLAALEKRYIGACQKFQAFLAENPIFSVQPTFHKKVYDWVPSCYTFSDDIKNFCNRVEPHSVEELRTYLTAALTQCAILPKKELENFVATKTFWDPQAWALWGITIPTEYYPTLELHQKKWKAIWEPVLQATFNLSYDQFIHSAELKDQPASPPRFVPTDSPKEEVKKEAKAPSALTDSLESLGVSIAPNLRIDVSSSHTIENLAAEEKLTTVQIDPTLATRLAEEAQTPKPPVELKRAADEKADSALITLPEKTSNKTVVTSSNNLLNTLLAKKQPVQKMPSEQELTPLGASPVLARSELNSPHAISFDGALLSPSVTLEAKAQTTDPRQSPGPFSSLAKNLWQALVPEKSSLQAGNTAPAKETKEVETSSSLPPIGALPLLTRAKSVPTTKITSASIGSSGEKKASLAGLHLLSPRTQLCAIEALQHQQVHETKIASGLRCPT